MADFVDKKRNELEERLRELEPLVEEYNRLQAAVSALASIGTSASGGATSRHRDLARPPSSSARKRAGKTQAAAKARRKASTVTEEAGAGLASGAGTRAAQALAIVQDQPGITIPELAARMGIKQNYLYRVIPSLEEGGRIKKQGRGWHPHGL